MHLCDTETLFAVNKTSERVPYESFERSSVGGFFELVGAPSDVDALFPPSKITDLHIIGRVSNMSVQVGWTAVGESLDSGTGNLRFQSLADSILLLRNVMRSTLFLKSILVPW